HDHVTDDLTYSRSHSSAFHGGRGGEAFPRVRRYPWRYNPDLGGCLTYPDADDVRTSSAPHPRGRTGKVLQAISGSIRRDYPVLWKNAALGARQADGYPARGGGNPGVHRIPVYYCAQRLLPGPGYRHYSGHLGGAAMDLFWGY